MRNNFKWGHRGSSKVLDFNLGSSVNDITDLGEGDQECHGDSIKALALAVNSVTMGVTEDPKLRDIIYGRQRDLLLNFNLTYSFF